VLLFHFFAPTHYTVVYFVKHLVMYLEVVVGAAQRRLDGGTRGGVEVAAEDGGGAVVADLVQRLCLRRRQVTPVGG